MLTLTSIIFSVICNLACQIPSDSIQHMMDMQRWVYPQEKISINTQQNSFISGDTTRLTIRVVDAATIADSGLSKYVYVELRNPFNNVEKRIKVKCDDAVAEAIMPLSHDLPGGEYTLIAYTRFMESPGPDFFYSKKINIASPARAQKKIHTSFTPTKKGKLKVDIQSYDAVTSLPTKSLISVKTKTGKEYSSVRKKDSFGCIVNEEDWRCGSVLVESDNYRTYMPLPPDSSCLTVTLHPEGGHFCKGVINTAGIKISDSCGRGIETEISILDQSKNLLSRIDTDKYGIGRFQYFANDDKNLHIVHNSDTIAVKIDVNAMPTVKVSTLNRGKISVQAVGNIPDESVLFTHCGGILQYYGNIKNDETISFNTSDLLQGVHEILLLDGDLRPMARRLVFVSDKHLDDEAIQLLLRDELRGEIPSSENLNDMTRRDIRYSCDNIMLVNDKWGRYDMAEAINGRYIQPSEPVEMGGVISGIAKTRWRRAPLEGARVDIIAPKIDYFATTTTDSEGKFLFEGIDWPDGTKFAVRVLNKNGEYEDNFELDEDSFPDIKTIPPVFTHSASTSADTIPDYLKDRLSTWLEEITVEGKRRNSEDDPNLSIYEIVGARTLSEEIIESRGITTYEEAIRLFPGLRVHNGNVIYAGANVSLFGGDNSVQLYIDDARWTSPIENASSGGAGNRFASASMAAAAEKTAITMTGGLIPTDAARKLYANTTSPLEDFASTFPFHTIEKIYYLKPNAAIFLNGAAARSGGALVFVRKGMKSHSAMNDNVQLKVYSPLGYQR